MTTIKNNTGTKAVHINKDNQGSVYARYVQIYHGEEQVLQAKFFASVKNAEKWANKVLA